MHQVVSKSLHAPLEVKLVLKTHKFDSVGCELRLQANKWIDFVSTVVGKVHLTFVEPVVLLLGILSAHWVVPRTHTHRFDTAGLARALQLTSGRQLAQAVRIELGVRAALRIQGPILSALLLHIESDFLQCLLVVDQARLNRGELLTILLCERDTVQVENLKEGLLGDLSGMVYLT